MNKVVLVRMGPDFAFWLNGHLISSGDANEHDDVAMIEEIARDTAKALRESAPGGCFFETIDREPPQDPEWNWNDVAEELQLS